MTKVAIIRMMQILVAGWVSAACGLLLGAIGWLTLAWRAELLPSRHQKRGRLRDTTIQAPCYWTLFAILVLTGTEIGLDLLDADKTTVWYQPVRYAAAVATFCPPMAVLGAKRPQDHGWQIVVLSLWLILLVPSTQWLLLQPGESMHFHPAW